MFKVTVVADRPQMTAGRMRIACWIPKANHTLMLHNTYCFPSSTLVARTHVNITSQVHCLSCFVYV